MSDMMKTRVTLQEFMAMPETNKLVELIDGEIVMSPPPKDPHQKTSWLTCVYLTGLMDSGELRYSPTDVVLDDENVPQPDLFWVAGEGSLCKLSEDGRWHGAPDLVIEILSPGTARSDKGVKFRLYEKHGVREYWLVEPEALYVEVWRLLNGKFDHLGVFGPGETFASTVLGNQTIEVNVIFGL